MALTLLRSLKMTYKEFLLECRKNDVRVHYNNGRLELTKSWIDWDGITRSCRIISYDLPQDEDINDDVVAFTFEEMDECINRKRLADRETVLREWVTAKQISKKYNIPYKRVLRDYKAGYKTATKIKGKWYCKLI